MPHYIWSGFGHSFSCQLPKWAILMGSLVRQMVFGQPSKDHLEPGGGSQGLCDQQQLGVKLSLLSFNFQLNAEVLISSLTSYPSISSQFTITSPNPSTFTMFATTNSTSPTPNPTQNPQSASLIAPTPTSTNSQTTKNSKKTLTHQQCVGALQ
jgi:hypothetical protein